MWPIGTKVQIYLYRGRTDMRKSFDGLSGLIRRELGQLPQSGDLFLFVNRRRDRLKMLVWDRDGFWIHYKRLEKGQFHLPSGTMENTLIGYDDLLLMLEGIDVQNAEKRLRYGR